MNESKVKAGVDTGVRAETDVPAGVEAFDGAAAELDGIRTGMGSELDQLLGEAAVPVQRFVCAAGRKQEQENGAVAAGQANAAEAGAASALDERYSCFDEENCSDENCSEEGTPENAQTATQVRQAGQNEFLKLSYNFSPDGRSGGAVQIEVCEGGELTVLMRFANAGEAGGFAAVQTRILLHKNAKLKLVQVHLLGDGFTMLNDLGIHCEEGAQAELLQLSLGGAKNYVGCETALAGDESSFASDLGYLVARDGRLDVNMNAVHTGRQGSSRMDASGVLRDRAAKLFRGTIDFRQGSAGSVGDEKEDVLLMSDTVVNQTVPLILCAEEDVQGNHGATIGRLDDELVFYLESRGLPREDVYEMMAAGRIEALSRRIPDSELRAQASAFAQRCLRG